LRRGAGTVAGGNIGLKISPHLLVSLARDRTIVLVSGTNGKTTTTALVAAGWGGDVASNTTGANMPAGHVAALARNRTTRVVLETDEAWLGEVVTATDPAVVVLLNLSRDQLDRANEVRRIAERWRAALATLEPSTVVVANANDPLVVWAAGDAANVRWCDVPTPWRADAQSCPRCTLPIEFDDVRWHCSCGFAKPTDLTTSLRGQLIVAGRTLELSLGVPGVFNEANAAMALSALHELGVDLGDALTRVNAVSTVAGRFSVRAWRGRRVRLLLAKNPAGFDALLSTLRADNDDVWIAINARLADGHDPSWLYDVAFETLRGRTVWCLGERRLDLATRLDYADVDVRVVDDLDDLPTSDDPVTLFANYTAFSEWLERSTPC
jgi:UDP-N-acetylmuramyl tripeptide synthase